MLHVALSLLAGTAALLRLAACPLTRSVMATGQLRCSGAGGSRCSMASTARTVARSIHGALEGITVATVPPAAFRPGARNVAQP